MFLSNITWESIDDYREMSTINNIIVIKPKHCDEIMAISCPLCGTMLRGIEDMEEMAKLNVCRQCANRWAYINYGRWQIGWRPSQEDIKIDLKNRKKSPVFQMSLNENN